MNDTRFSMVGDNLKTQPIGFGQAFIHGCPLNVHHDSANSITNCYFSNAQQNLYHANLKSMFSINLQKTGLVIDNDIDQWIIDDGNNDLLEKNMHISQVINYIVFIFSEFNKFFLNTEWRENNRLL